MYYFLIILTLLSSQFAYGEKTTLADIVNLAKDRYEQFDIIAKNQDIQSHLNKQTKSTKFPNISVVESKRYNKDDNLAFESNIQQRYLSLRQPVFHYADILSRQKTDNNTRLAELTYQNDLQQVIYQIIEAYFNLLNTKVQYEQSKKHKSYIRKHFDTVDKRYKNRDATKIDLIESKLSYDQSILELDRLKNQLDLYQTNLYNYIEKIINIDDLIALDYENFENFKFQSSFDYWQDQLANNYQLKIANERLNIASKDVKIAQAGHFPTVDFSVQNYFNDIQRPKLITPFSTVGQSSPERIYSLQVSVPVFGGFLTQAKVSQAETSEDQARLRLSQSEKSIASELKNRYESMKFNLERARLLNDLMKLSKEKLTVTEQSFALNQRTSDDVIFALDQLNSQIRDYKLAVHRYVLDYFALKRLVGTLASDIIADSQLLYKR